MLLKSKELLIDPDQPFLNDQLGRKESAEVLTQFVLSTDEPLVICIDAPWGQGKTTFLKMWECHLRALSIPSLYFNAWENDFTDDALVSLIGEISCSIDQLSNKGDSSKAKEHLKKAKSFGIALLKRSLPVAAKVVTAGALDLDKVSEQAFASFAESIAKEEIEKYEQSKKTLSNFRETLKDFAQAICSPDDPKPLVFIIDELDRCRPNFSIEVLEKAKHFFNVPNIVFVLGADKTQLGHSVRAIYGRDLDVNGYLRRFIDFDYILPTPEKGVFIKSLFRKFEFDQYFSNKSTTETRYEKDHSLKMFSELVQIYDLSLREQEHCCSLLSLAIKTTPDNYLLYPLFLCFLIVLKIKKPDLYKSFANETLEPQELFEIFEKTKGAKDLLNSNYGMALEAHILTSKSHRIGADDVLEKYSQVVKSTSSSEEEKNRANRIMEIIRNFDWNGGIGILGYLVNKIEIASRFKR